MSGYMNSPSRPYSPGPAQPGGPPMGSPIRPQMMQMGGPPRPYPAGNYPPGQGSSPRPQGYPPQRPMGPPQVGYGRPVGTPKRPADARGPPMSRPGGPNQPPQQQPPKKKKKLADKILPQRVRDLVPESQAYMDLLAFERKLDFTIMRKRLDIQESLKRPMKQKRKLRIFISNTFFPGQNANEAPADGAPPQAETVPSWELRVEGRLLEDTKEGAPKGPKRKFSSFFKSLVIELDKELYGPDNHLVEWHRTPTTNETDGFQVKRPGDRNVRCTILLLLDYQPLQFKLDPRLARLLGIHTQTRPVIIAALWQYVRTHNLQDSHEREFINCDKYLEQIFQTTRMKFAEIPQRLHQLLHPPDPIVINHLITVDAQDTKKTACYDIDVEIDDTLKSQMNQFVLSTSNQQEIQQLEHKIHETVETINQLKTHREFFLSFAKEPQCFVNKWLISQSRDLKTMTDVVGNPEEERRADFYHQRWASEAVCRYFYGKVQQKRAELEQALGIRT
ncbi:SWI/SNF-related matrix-associated actin-dependent regulator of chromatin subfamily D member 1 [Galendromus occidentalis]|uniref:SWI/SNF-related matrix-associated actin-dependent regulator of chromatin subfamily D member 1 n=1 Tax=Galendromus occidentalis TaxID=34638 RepID=A0AAJ6VXL5_9ACAR|nr:SWI/SNF-related matrix-associated actin-dependent regulator of chromatin subfamily D member 1 [Galendromus occidentalis]